MVKKLLTIFTLLITGSPVISQVLQTTPPSLKWSAVEAPHFQVIFPMGFESEAQRTANTLEHLYGPTSKTLNANPKKISLILQNQDAVSNGFVSYSPRRSEFFTMPPQDYNLLGTLDWIDLLAVHEFRHVVQFDAMNKGFNKFVYGLTGQSGYSLMASLAAPRWYWEGDAVVSETAQTLSGRGRIPAFGLEFKTNLLQLGRFNYHKAHLGSFKNFIPNHYRLGYYLNAYLRNTYDEKVLSQVIDNASRKSWVPLTFSNSLKKYTNKHLVDQYNDMADDMLDRYESLASDINFTQSESVVSGKANRWTSYMFPQVGQDGKVVAIRSGIGDIAQIVEVDNGKIKVLHTPGNVNNAGQLSMEAGKIVWAEVYNNPRWLRSSQSYIKIYNKHHGLINTLKQDGRLVGPVLDANGERIAAIKSDKSGNNSIVILSAIDGEVIREVSHPENSYFSNLRWHDSNSLLLGIRHSAKGKSLMSFDFDKSEFKDLTNASHVNISHPVPYKKYVLYNSPISGIDNIYALDLESGDIYQITRSKYGAYNPEVWMDTLYFNDYGVNGMEIHRFPLTTEEWKPFSDIKKANLGLIDNLVKQEGGNVLQNIEERDDPVVPYKQGKNLLNIYEWGPLLSTAQESLFIGASSRDVLSKFSSSAGYTFDGLEGSGYGSLNLSYQGWYPIIDLGVNYGTRRSSDTFSDSTGINDVNFNWRELGVSGGLRIPLRFFHSSFIHQITIANSLELTQVSDFENDVTGQGRLFFSQLDNGSLITNRFSLNLFSQLKMSKRDINPKWGGFAILESWSTPYGGDFDGNTFVLRGGVYLPGFFKHHSIFITSGYQDRKITLQDQNYFYRNRLPFPRGFGGTTWERMRVFSTNYQLPVWYPDVAMGPVLNIQRIRFNAFYDYGYGDIDVSEQNLQVKGAQEYSGLGGELRFDINVLRYHALFDIGVRATYTNTTRYNQGGTSGAEGVQFELLIGTFGF